jgi:isopentenyl diphosphate isomerase/L-lactate dehydrogenase-like FMN-dependent dehydrogenase
MLTLPKLYLNRDRSASEKLIQKVEKLGAKAIMFTVDVCWQSKRTMDVRTKATPGPSPSAPSSAPKGVSQAISGYQDTNLTWKDIPFIRVSLPPRDDSLSPNSASGANLFDGVRAIRNCL